MVVEFDRRGCFTQAAALTYTSLLALTPLMFVLFTLLSMFPLFNELKGSIQHFIFGNFLPETGQILENYVMQFMRQANKLPVTSLVFLAVTALMMLFTIDQAMRATWVVKIKRRVSLSILLYLGVLLFGPLLIGASIGITSYVISLHILGNLPAMGMQKIWILLPFLCTFLAFWFLYTVVPHCKVQLSHAAAGAFLAACLFEGGKQVFGWYVIHFPTYQVLYGALATIPIFLLWVYCSWSIFLFGSLLVDGLRTSAIWRQ